LYSRYSGWWGNEPEDRTDFPGEHECEQKRDEDWREAFSEEDLAAEYSSFCIRTAEGISASSSYDLTIPKNPKDTVSTVIPGFADGRLRLIRQR
jgi:hypothetical protein